jgi:hypothetical protein
MGSSSGQSQSGPHRSARPSLARFLVRDERIFPTAIVVVLCLPVLGLGYFWDDYSFLTMEGTGDPRVYLLPASDASFYRPIPMSLYFLLLLALDPANGWLGHVVNLAVLATSTFLFTSMVSKLAGRQAGFVSGTYFAALAAVPSLVAWITCSHDLFALAFLLLSLTLRHAGRNGWALAVYVCALLSKEPALVFAPVLVLWDWLVGRRSAGIVRHAIAYGVVALAWMLIHPGFQTLLTRGFHGGATGYIGLGEPERWVRHALRFAVTFLNVPVTGLKTPWPDTRTGAGIVAVALLWIGILSLRVRKVGSVGNAVVHGRRALLLGLLLVVPPVLLASMMVELWSPYYACLPALGVALLAGFLLRRLPPQAVGAALGLFLLLGVWCRGMVLSGEAAWTEPVFVDASRAARTVEAHFKRLHPTFPPGSQILASVTATGTRGIRATLHEAQALRIWYRDPSLVTVTPEQRAASRPMEYLFRVTAGLDVVEIDPERLRVQWSGTGTPHPWEVSRPLRGYARALAASGEIDRAVGILRRLAEIEQQDQERAYDLRLAAMVLLAAGRQVEADSTLGAAAPFPREVALEIVKKLFTEATRSARLDSLAFPAFGLSAEDPEALRYLMRRFRQEGDIPRSLDFARRLRGVRPGDTEAEALLRDFRDRRRAPPA